MGDDSGPPLEYILGRIPRVVKGRYMGLSSWIMFIWDHAILFDQEVEYIWRGKEMSMNKIYLFLRYTGLILFALNYFMLPKTDQLSVYALVYSHLKPNSPDLCNEGGVWKHLTLWPQLIDTALSEYVLAARVVVVWENNKWARAVVIFAWFGAIASTLTLFGLDSQGLAEAISISGGLSFYDCVASVPYDITWTLWLTFLVYNSFLGLMVLFKAITTYRRDQLQRNHSRLWKIVVRGSFHYYLIITAVNIATLYASGYGSEEDSNVHLTLSGPYMSPYICITNLLACRLILQLARAYYRPVVSGNMQTGGYSKRTRSEEISDSLQGTIELRRF